MITYDELVRSGARYLERSWRCPKHHVEHTGSNCYLLDFYTELGEVEKGKRLVERLLKLVVSDGAAQVFYPGRLNQMNMSNSVIDSGSAVDAIARFLRLHPEVFSAEERARVMKILSEVVETYVAEAAVSKPITNQRLWGATGVASYAALVGEEARYRALLTESIERAFEERTPDGFFRYYPEAAKHGTPASYDGITTFYQSRHSAFIRYVLEQAKINIGPYEEPLAQSDRALLSMYRSDGIKDLRLECKRWYWQSSYEVASHGFDTYALAYAKQPEAGAALHNALYQVRNHFTDGHLHSHHGPDINFQCPIFWTAHLAWMLRSPDIRQRFDTAVATAPLRYTFLGKEVITHTTPLGRTLINGRFMTRNPSTGIYQNGLHGPSSWALSFPRLPEGLMFSIRETLNHIWYALRGLHLREALVRLVRLVRELGVMFLPRYSDAYGKIDGLTAMQEGARLRITGLVTPASKYGSLHGTPNRFSIDVPL